jgi:hypothetical protein
LTGFKGFLHWTWAEIRRLFGFDLRTANKTITGQISQVLEKGKAQDSWRRVSVEDAREVHEQAVAGYENILERVQALLAVLAIVLIAPPILLVQLDAEALIWRLKAWPWESTTLAIGYYGFLALQMTLSFVAILRVIRQIPAKMVYYPDVQMHSEGVSSKRSLTRTLLLTLLGAIDKPPAEPRINEEKAVEYMTCSELNGLQVVSINNYLSSSLQLLSDCLWCLLPMGCSYAGLLILAKSLHS